MKKTITQKRSRVPSGSGSATSSSSSRMRRLRGSTATRRQPRRALDSTSKKSSVVLTVDYTSARSEAYGEPEVTPEPLLSFFSRKRKRRKKAPIRQLFFGFAGFSLVFIWVVNHYYFSMISMPQSNIVPSVSAFSGGAGGKITTRASETLNERKDDSITKTANTTSLSTQKHTNVTADISPNKPMLRGNDATSETIDDKEIKPAAMMDITHLSLTEKGAPEAKFLPQPANQIISQLVTVQIPQKDAHQRPPPVVSKTMASPFQPKLSLSLEQCAAVLYNKNSLMELVYWETHPEDYKLQSPLSYQSDQRFLTFELPMTGFSAQRRALEHMVILSFSLGRTLVLPPRQGMFDGTLMGSLDYFDISSNPMFKGVHIISMEEFLQRIAPFLAAQQTQLFGRNNWDGAEDIQTLYQYLRTTGTIPTSWDPERCFIGYSFEQLSKLIARIMKRVDGRAHPTPWDFQGKPKPVKAPELERLREFMAERRQICSHGKNKEKDFLYPNEILLHIPAPAEPKNGNENNKNSQISSSVMEVPFYTFFFQDNSAQDLVLKRMVRDSLRYNDVIVCAAARIVDWFRYNVGHYHALHIRHPSYEDKFHSEVHAQPEWILHDVQKYLPHGSHIYIATDYYSYDDGPDDVKDKNWFAPLQKKYQLYFSSDFRGVLEHHLPNHYTEMVEQLICARAEIFVGTWKSSFSSYIHRLRGYYSPLIKDEDTNEEEGSLNNSFYASPVAQQQEMSVYQAIRRPFNEREFPIAWRDIDHDVAVPKQTKPKKN